MKKKIDIIVEARTFSTRLPGKVLLKVLNRPLLDLMIERLKLISKIDSIIIATTINEKDNEIEKLAKNNNVKCFRGSETDVLGRVVMAAKEFKTDIIVQTTGDNPLVDKNVSEQLINFFINNYEIYDFVSNDAGIYNSKFKQEFPMGLNTKVFKSSLLFDVEKKTKNPVDREHVVNYILKNYQQFKVHDFKAEKIYSRPDLRFTLDYMEDYKVIKLIFENLYEKNKKFTAIDIFKFLDDNPDIKNLNTNRCQKKYTY